MFPWSIVCAKEGMRKLFIENIGNQCAFARARNTGDRYKFSEWYIDCHILQVVLTCSLDRQKVSIAGTVYVVRGTRR